MALFNFVIGESAAAKAERLRKEEEFRKEQLAREEGNRILAMVRENIIDEPFVPSATNLAPGVDLPFEADPTRTNREANIFRLAQESEEVVPGFTKSNLPLIQSELARGSTLDTLSQTATPDAQFLINKGLPAEIFSGLQSNDPQLRLQAANRAVDFFNQFGGSASKSLGTQFGQATGIRQAIPGLEDATDFDAIIAGTIKEKNEISQGTLGQRLAEDAIFAHQRHRIAAQYAKDTDPRKRTEQTIDGIRSFNRTIFKEKQTEIDNVISDNAKIAQDIKDIINNNTELYAWSVPEKFTTRTTGESLEISPLQILTTVKDIDPKQSSAVVRTYFEANDIDPEELTDKQMDRFNDAIGMYNKMLESPISRGDANDALQLGTLQQKFLSNRLAIGELQRHQRDIQTIQVEGFTTINPSTGEQMYVPPDETIFSLAGGQTLSGSPTGTLLTSPRDITTREPELPGIKPVSPIERKPESTAGATPPVVTDPSFGIINKLAEPVSNFLQKPIIVDPEFYQIIDPARRAAKRVKELIQSTDKSIGRLSTSPKNEPSREAEVNKEAIRQSIISEVSRLQTMTPEQLVSNPNTRGIGTADSVVKTAERIIKQKGGNPDDFKKELQDLADEVIKARTKMGL